MLIINYHRRDKKLSRRENDLKTDFQVGFTKKNSLNILLFMPLIKGIGYFSLVVMYDYLAFRCVDSLNKKKSMQALTPACTRGLKPKTLKFISLPKFHRCSTSHPHI